MGDGAALLSTLGQISRATGCGLGLHAGASLLSSILKGTVFKSDFHEWNPATVSCVKFGAFIGGFAGTYRFVLQLLKRWRGQGDVNALVAAAVASWSTLLQPSARRHLLALLLGARAFSSIFRILNLCHGIRPPNALIVALFCINSAVLVHGAMLYPQCLPPSYYRSVLKWSNRFTDDLLGKLFRPLPPSHKHRPTCQELIHPSTSCPRASFTTFLQCWLQSSKIYGVLTGIPLLLFRFKTLWKRPLATILQFMKGTVRSGYFLGVAVWYVSLGTCIASRNAVIRQYNTPIGHVPHLAALLIGAAAGSAILLERSSRHIELLAYTVPLVIYTLVRHLQRIGVLPEIKDFSVVFFALPMMVMMYAHDRRRKSLAPWMASFLDVLVK